MTQTLLTTLPQPYFEAMEPVFLAAKENLERDGHLVPFAFLGNLSTLQVMPVQINTSSYEAKIESAKHVTRVAVMVAADYVALAMESYSLPKNKVHLHADIVEKYGSIAESPYGIEVVSFSIETPTTIWMAQCPIKPLRNSKKRKTFKTPTATDFMGVSEGAGIFVGLLPGSRIVDPSERDDSRTLH